MKLKKNGFTLVEIIVVLLILAILTAIAVPSMLGYVKEARNSEIIAEAHNVLIASKTEATNLKVHDQLSSITSNKDIHDKIMKRAEVDGDLLSIDLNEKQTSSGDFVVKIKDKFVQYIDSEKEFKLLDKAPDISFAINVKNQLLSKDFIDIINNYFDVQKRYGGLDSEGPNTGAKFKELFRSKGIDPDKFSFRIYKKKDGSNNTITISTAKITNDMKGKTVSVIQFDYGNSTDFSKEPIIKKADVPVDTKTVKDTNNKDYTFPLFDLSNAQWIID